MSLEHAILGFLNYHPYTGYDLKKIFDTSVQHFWSADQSQIYRTLNSLTKRGMVRMEKVRQEDRPDRKVYHLTDEGLKELQKWLAGPPPMSSPHSSSLVQIFFAAQLPDEVIVEKLEGFAASMRATLARYEQVPESIEPYRQEIDSPREHFFWMLTLENGMRTMSANLAWVESILERFKNKEVPQ